MSEIESSPDQNIPEPLPIPVDPSLDGRARDFLQAVTLGQIDRTLLNEQLNQFWQGNGTAAAAEHAAALGAVEEMYAFEQDVTAEGVATFYRVRYAAGIWTWVFSVDQAGRINGFSLRRNPRYKIYDVWLRNVRY